MTLTRKEAIAFLELDEKVFDNFFRSAGEFSPLPRERNRGRFQFEEETLAEWKRNYESRRFSLTRKDYAKCIDFSLAMHFRGYVLSDWGTGRQREFGQKVSNWVRGQLGEIGVQYLARERLNLDVELDFDMHDEVVPQDVLSIIENGIRREPAHDIAIKASKPKSAFLVLSQNEIERNERRSEIYIFTRVDLPDDHLLRVGAEEVRGLVQDQQHYQLYESLIPVLEPIPVEIAGFAYIDELETVEEIPGQRFEGVRYVKKTGELHRHVDEWREVFE